MTTTHKTEHASYAWIIDRDHLGDEPEAIGRRGPRDLSPELAWTDGPKASRQAAAL